MRLRRRADDGQGRRRHRRRRHDRRRRLRGDPPGRRPGTPIVVVLNDNGMSIAPNVGALSRYFNRVRLNPKLWHAREGVEDRLTELPGGIGARVRAPRPAAQGVDQGVLGAGPVVGGARLGLHRRHRRPRRAARCARALREALAAERPVVVHVATVKGKGFAPAEEGGLEGMEKWHAAKPKLDRQPAPAAPARKPPAPSRRRRSTRRSSARRWSREVRARPARRRHHRGDELRHRPRASCRRRCPSATSTSASPSSRRCCSPPGLALAGRQARSCAIYSTFLQRAYDQIVHDVCLQKLNVVFAMDRAGLVGDDGPTHHGAFDIAYLRCLPNIVLMAPRDEAMLVAHAAHRADLRRRPGRAALPARRGRRRRRCRARPQPIEIGTRRDPARGRRGWRSSATAPACGKALEAADLLAEGGLDVDGRRRALRQAARRRAARAARRRARAARDGRGGRAGRRLRLGRAGSASTTTGGQVPRILRVGLPDRYVDPRQARAAARGGRLHRPSAIAERIEAAIAAGTGALASA